MDVMAAAAQLEADGHHIIHMEVGQPGSPAPRCARDAAARALEDEPLGYTLAAGLPSLRQRIVKHYRDRYGVEIAPERVIVTTGSSAGFVLAFLAAFEAGNTVALPRPGYPCYRQILKALGQAEVALRTTVENRWMPTLEQIEDARAQYGIKGVLIASPANPTGTMLARERLRSIAQYCDDNGLWFISDEIYHGLTYGLDETTAAGAGRNVIVVNSFSKYFSMTGWRIGWLIVPQHLTRAVERLQQNLYISPPTISQIAAEAAFDGHDELEQNRSVYETNRRLLLDGLAGTRLSEAVPADGAFYLYCDVSQWCDDSYALTQTILREAHVALTPGIDFDPELGHGFVRLSYARSTADIREGLARLRRWLQQGT